ncbi:MAG TPA: BatA domain-containing protein [Planctomycetota bacterium]|nr:BatA domain-containing protein [Planctomycetota bacterium]
MSFLNPAFLWALPLVALPVLIHLLNRQKYQRVDFAAMEFLLRARKKLRKRLLLEDLLLLALRTFAVLFFILALARPGQELTQSLTGRPTRGEVLLLDASMSMHHRSRGQSSFERAVQEGKQILENLDESHGDQAAFILARDSISREAFGNPGEVLSTLVEQTRPSFGNTNIAKAATWALRSAEALAAEGCEEVTVTFLSDLQASTWNFDDEAQTAFGQLKEAGFTLRIQDVGSVNRENTAVTRLEVEPQRVAPGEMAEVQVTIRHFAGVADSSDGSPKLLHGKLFLDQSPIAEVDLEIPWNGESSWSHLLTPAESGSRGLEFRIDSDACIPDDLRTTIFEVASPPEVLLVGEGASNAVQGSLSRFLDFPAPAPLRLQESALHSLTSATLAKSDLLILADPTQLSPRFQELIHQFVGSGGGLLLALGPETNAADCESLLSVLGAPSIQIGEPQKYADPSARLLIQDETWPPLAFFQDPRWKPLLTEIPIYAFRPISVETPNTNSFIQTPLTLVRDSGEDSQANLSAALLTWQLEGGRIAVFTTPPHPGWNRFEEVPGGTLPFLFDLCGFLANGNLLASSLPIGSHFQLILPTPPVDIQLENPNGERLRPQAEAVAYGARFIQPLLAKALLPGVWTATAQTMSSDGDTLSHKKKFSVVVPESESNLTPISSTLLVEVLPEAETAQTQAESPRSLSAHSSSEDASSILFLLVLLFLVTETALASFLDRRRG